MDGWLGVFFWGFLLAYGALMWVLSPHAVSAGGGFRGEDAAGRSATRRAPPFARGRHGEESRRIWGDLWPGRQTSQVPIGHVTNGIHIPSWISQEMSDLLDRYLGPRWLEDPSNTDVWNRIEEIPDEELWRTHERRKERLIAFARRRLVSQLKRRGTSETELATAKSILNSEHLTIGFARRFATYKRATLLLRNMPGL